MGMLRRVAFGIVALSVSPFAWGDSLAEDGAAAFAGGLLVASRGSDKVLRYDRSGAPKGVFASDPALVKPVGTTFGPDGNVYVAVGDTNRVMRFDGKTGRSLGIFTRGASIESPRNVNFGPDGAFYVADGFLNQVLRFDGRTGSFDRVFIRDPALNGPTSFTFGPDGDVYVASVLTNSVLRFDGGTGALRGPFATTALTQPHDVSFGPDGNLYVTNSGSGIVQRFRGDTGAYLGAFVTDSALRQPLGMAWGLDGNLYVANQGGNEVRRYDGSTGASLGALVTAGAGGLSAPSFLVFLPAPKLALAATVDAERGTILLKVSGARPGGRVLVAHGTAGGSATLRECPRLRLAIGSPSIDQTRFADESGNTLAALESRTGARVSFVAIDAGRCVATKPVPITVP
jgi:streptogramin lyase